MCCGEYNGVYNEEYDVDNILCQDETISDSLMFLDNGSIPWDIDIKANKVILGVM